MRRYDAFDSLGALKLFSISLCYDWLNSES